MKKIINYILGKREKTPNNIKPDFIITFPPQQINFAEWCDEFKVGVLSHKHHYSSQKSFQYETANFFNGLKVDFNNSSSNKVEA